MLYFFSIASKPCNLSYKALNDLNNSSLINLVSKEVESEEVETEEQKITVKESEIQVTSDKRVEYQ